MTVSSDDPWQDLDLPPSDRNVNSRRVDPEHPWDFFWARGRQHLLLVMIHDPETARGAKLPTFRGFRVRQERGTTTGRAMLLFELTEAEHRPLFHRLCLDIMASTTQLQDEATAVTTAIGRTWRWHHLLRGGRDDRLSAEEQRGLIGELHVLQELLVPRLGVMAALSAWTGPVGTPKDFEIGTTCLESKARGSSTRSRVEITSEFQLDTEGLDRLYLVVTDIDLTPTVTATARTVTEQVDSTLEQIGMDAQAESLLYSRLSAIGYRHSDDYSDFLWIIGRRRVSAVREDFPRVASASLLPGVVNLRYFITLEAIRPFEVEETDLEIPDYGYTA